MKMTIPFKKIPIRCVAPIFCILSLTICLFFPEIFLSLHDMKHESRSTTYHMNPITFQPNSSLTDTMHMLAKGHYTVDVDVDKALHTPQEIHQLLSDFIENLSSHGVNTMDTDSASLHMEDCFMGVSVSPYTSVSPYSHASSATDVDMHEDPGSPNSQTLNGDPVEAAILWSCSISFENGEEFYGMIDDSTGKLLSLSYTSTTPFLDIADTENNYRTAVCFQEFISDLYDNYMIHLEYMDDYKVSNECSFVLQFVDKNQNQAVGILSIHDNSYDFYFI